MISTHSLHTEQKMMNRGDQLQLVQTYSRFLKLRKSGFPFSDARNMTGLTDDLQFRKAQEIYQSYL